MWSFDDGKTYQNQSTISYPPKANMGALIGPAVGIQSKKGTIYFSAFIPGSPHFLYWSKDYGKTWESSSGSINGLNECSIAFIQSESDGDIMMNCRTSSHRRAVMTWAQDGTPKSEVSFPTGLIDPNCQGSNTRILIFTVMIHETFTIIFIYAKMIV